MSAAKKKQSFSVSNTLDDVMGEFGVTGGEIGTNTPDATPEKANAETPTPEARCGDDPLGLTFETRPYEKKDVRVQLVFRRSDWDLIEQLQSQTALSINEWITQVLTGYARQKLASLGIEPIEGFSARTKQERARERARRKAEREQAKGGATNGN